LKPGETFRANLAGAHWRVLVWGPCAHGNVLVVGVTSDEERLDRTCPIQPKELPGLDHESFVHYGDAKIGPASGLQRALDTNQVVPGQPVTDDILRRIVDGFSESRHARPRYDEFAHGRCACDRRSSS